MVTEIRGPTVLVWSPHPVVRAGAAALLADSRHPPRVVASPAHAGPPVRVDVVLYDVLGLVVGDGLDLDRLVEAGTAVLALARPLHPHLAAHAVTRGAVAWVSMAVDADHLAAAVEEAAHLARTRPGVPGQRPTRPGVDWRVVSDGIRETSGVALTARQAEVLDAVASGCPNRDIAEALHLSHNTVKTYVRTTYRALGVHSRAQAASWARRHGLGPDARPAPRSA